MSEIKPMKIPVHPGRLFRNTYLTQLELSVSECAKLLGVSRQALYNFINERSSLSVEMALRIGRAFDVSPEFWLRLQNNYNLALARERADDELQVQRYEGPITLPE